MATALALLPPDVVDVSVFGGLTVEEFDELKGLAARDPRTLSEDDLSMFEALPRWALYRGDDGSLPEFCGAGLCACDGPCVNERDDLTHGQRTRLHRLRRLALREKVRRRDLRHGPRWRPAAELPGQLVELRPHVARARPRERRAARTRSRARSPGRPADDDPEPDLTLRPSLGLSWLEAA